MVRIRLPPAQSQERTTERPKSGCDAGRAAWAQPDPPERAMRRCWLTFAAAALVTGAYAAQAAVPAAETSPAPISGIAPSYGPKTVSAVPNPGLDAGYDPQGLAVDGGGIYVSAYRSDSFGVRRGPCRVIHIDLETGGPTHGGSRRCCGPQVRRCCSGCVWASVSLALYVAFWLELDNPYWAGTSAAIVCQPHLGASLRKGWFRMIAAIA
jgi:Fusaric acid resistance protein family